MHSGKFGKRRQRIGLLAALLKWIEGVMRILLPTSGIPLAIGARAIPRTAYNAIRLGISHSLYLGILTNVCG